MYSPFNQSAVLWVTALISPESVQSVEQQAHVIVFYFPVVFVFHHNVSVISEYKKNSRDKKSGVYFKKGTHFHPASWFSSDNSDGQQNSVMIHFRSAQAALIFSAFVPAVPSLARRKRKVIVSFSREMRCQASPLRLTCFQRFI